MEGKWSCYEVCRAWIIGFPQDHWYFDFDLTGNRCYSKILFLHHKASYKAATNIDHIDEPDIFPSSGS